LEPTPPCGGLFFGAFCRVHVPWPSCGSPGRSVAPSSLPWARRNEELVGVTVNVLPYLLVTTGQSIETIIEFIEPRPVDRRELLGAFTLGKAGLLVRKERDRIAQDIFFAQANYPSRFQRLLPEVARVIRKVLPVAAVGHVIPVPVIPQQQSLPTSR